MYKAEPSQGAYRSSDLWSLVNIPLALQRKCMRVLALNYNGSYDLGYSYHNVLVATKLATVELYLLIE